MGLVSSVLITLRLGLRNGSHNIEQARMRRILLYDKISRHPAGFVCVLVFKGVGTSCWETHGDTRGHMRTDDMQCNTQRHAGVSQLAAGAHPWIQACQTSQRLCEYSSIWLNSGILISRNTVTLSLSQFFQISVFAVFMLHWPWSSVTRRELKCPQSQIKKKHLKAKTLNVYWIR